ncbi:MAG: hypothetical protein QM755_24610 [Luteolibacter sp.]
MPPSDSTVEVALLKRRRIFFCGGTVFLIALWLGSMAYTTEAYYRSRSLRKSGSSGIKVFYAPWPPTPAIQFVEGNLRIGLINVIESRAHTIPLPGTSRLNPPVLCLAMNPHPFMLRSPKWRIVENGQNAMELPTWLPVVLWGLMILVSERKFRRRQIRMAAHSRPEL